MAGVSLRGGQHAGGGGRARLWSLTSVGILAPPYAGCGILDHALTLDHVLDLSFPIIKMGQYSLRRMDV